MQRGDRSVSGQPSPSSNADSTLDDASLTTINELLRLSREFRQSTSQVRRIQRGSPGAGALGATVASFNVQMSSKTLHCQQAFARCSQVPGIKVLEAKFKDFQDVLQEPFNDGGNEHGYSQRVHVLEKLNYANGKLCGAIEVIIEHHDHWRRKLTGQQPQPINRRLDFDTASSPTQTEATQTTTTTRVSTSATQNRSQLQLNQGLAASVTLHASTQQPVQNMGGFGGGDGGPLAQPVQNLGGLGSGRGGLQMGRLGGGRGGLQQGGLGGGRGGLQRGGLGGGRGGLQQGGLRSGGGGLQLSGLSGGGGIFFGQPAQNVGGLGGRGIFFGQPAQNVGGLGGGGGVCAQPARLSALSGIGSQLSQAPMLNFSQSSLGLVSIPASLSGQSQPQPLGATIQASGLGTTTPVSTSQNILYLPRQPPSQNGTPVTAEDLGQISTRKVTLSIKQLSHFCKGIADLWESKRHTDVILLVGEGRLQVHRVILASQSLYFDRLFFGNMREAQQKEIKINDVENLKAFTLLIQYAYSGQMDIKDLDIEEVTDVLKLSDQFGFEILKSGLGDKLVNHISTDNVLTLLSSADAYNVTALLDKCHAFIERDAYEVLRGSAIQKVNGHVLGLILSRDTLCMPEVEVFHTVIRWKESNHLDKEEIKEVLDCVRLTEIPLLALTGEVVASSLFDDRKILQATQAQLLPNFKLMRPRGIKKIGINLINSGATADRVMSTSSGTAQPLDQLSDVRAVITLDPPPTMLSTLGQPPNPQPAGLFYGRPTFGQPPSNHHQQQRWSSVRVTLTQEHLVNTIELEGFPIDSEVDVIPGSVADSEIPMLNQELRPLSFSYMIRISKDGREWEKLLNYSKYQCHRVQKLTFPTLAFKFFEFELMKATQQFTLELLKCSYEESATADFRPDGIIAPQTPLKPLAYQTQVSPTELSVVFNQPYSISTLRFKVCGPEKQKADIVVYVGSNDLTGTQRIELGQIKEHPINEHLKVSFDERIITTFNIEINEMQNVPLSEVCDTSLPDHLVGGHKQDSDLNVSLTTKYRITDLTCQAREQ